MLEESLPFARRRDIPICGHWQVSLRARAAFERNEWDAALADAAKVIDSRGMRVATLWPMLIGVLVPLRRGEPVDLDGLDSAWRLAARIAEPNARLAVLIAQVEAMWTRGTVDQRVRAFAEAELRAVRDAPGLGWAAGALATWMRRIGLDSTEGPYRAEPFDLLAAGEHRRAAEWFDAVGEPFAAALASADSGEPEAVADAIRVLTELGAHGTARRLASRRM